MNNTQKNALYSLILVVAFISVYFYRQYYASTSQTQNSEAADYMRVEGTTMGVVKYQIKYQDSLKRNFKKEIDSILVAFNQSLSTYIPDSEISTFNQNQKGFAFGSAYFYPVLEKSQEVYEVSQGSFDPTVGPLVNSWGFGNKKIEKKPTPEQVDSLKQLVGFEKVSFTKDSVLKAQAEIELNFSAIAKGYAIDVVAQFLETKQIKNYLVEIGREVLCKGLNAQKETWTIGIINPLYKEAGQKQLQAKVKLENRALASSGNYENYWEEDGKKYAHIIDPKTGYPVKHSLLSASVFAPDCMTADAYATAFIVLGLKESKDIIESQKDLDAFLIYADEEGNLKTYTSDGIKEFFD